VPKVIK